MDLNALMQQALLRHGNTPGVILKANEPTGQQPWEMFVTEEHTEHYLALKAGGETYRGMPTGVMGFIALGMSFFTVLFALDSDWQSAGMMLTFSLALVVPAFLWEISQPLPLPILFSRRTREIYYDHDGELYHMPWDEAQAVACQFMTVGPHSGGMDNATLETVVRRYGDAEQALFISLVPPMGRRLEMQQGLWAWLQAYMDNGPWFDENGQHSESDAHVKEAVEIGKFRLSDSAARYWRIIRGQESNGISKKPRLTDFVMLVLSLMLFPIFKIQDLTYAAAKRRSRGNWPPLVTERLRADGPTTRLIDLEREQGLNV
ncbi:hypothetical protein ACIPK7_27185 [Pseudomonas sp. NPDC086581]|uniref:hypothetical protein n=1 Tax=Pseudomonas sp. NPDC086581 TaxID=3364432 RepID=UPI003812CCB3